MQSQHDRKVADPNATTRRFHMSLRLEISLMCIEVIAYVQKVGVNVASTGKILTVSAYRNTNRQRMEVPTSRDRLVSELYEYSNSCFPRACRGSFGSSSHASQELVYNLGVPFVYPPAITISRQYFGVQRHYLANGIISSGSTFGGCVLSYLVKELWCVEDFQERYASLAALLLVF